MTVRNILYKTIGFFEYENSYISQLIKSGYTLQELDYDTKTFLKNNYYHEYISLMLEGNNYGVSTFTKKLKHELTIISKEQKVIINQVQVYLFNDSFKKNQAAIFSLDYHVLDKSITAISDITNELKNKKCKIIFKGVECFLDDFIFREILETSIDFGNDSFYEYSGSRYKNYLIVDCDNEILSRDNLLYELGTSSKIDTINDKSIYAPSDAYFNRVLDNKISLFNNYDCLALLNSFTVIGNNNYNSQDPQTFNTWNSIYFSIYIYNLYLKSSFQVILNDFTSDPIKKRKEFNYIFNKYFFKKISYNFLPNELNQGISNSLELNDDIEFIRLRLDTLANQINEKQQGKQQFLLLCLSVIALLETPLHIDGIREILGINNLLIYNSSVYPSLILLLILLVFLKFKEKI